MHLFGNVFPTKTKREYFRGIPRTEIGCWGVWESPIAEKYSLNQLYACATNWMTL